jgi:DNA-binding IclR family transcriptional regulator
VPTAAEPHLPVQNAMPQSVVGRVLTLLTAFRPGDAELTLAELHRRTGIAKPTAHRLLAELDGWDVIERTPTGIRLGMRLFELGQLVPRQRGLLEAAAPFLTDPDRLAPAVRTAALGVSRVLRRSRTSEPYC